MTRSLSSTSPPLLALLAALVAALGFAVPAVAQDDPPTPEVVLYDDAPRSGLEDWSWSATVDLADTAVPGGDGAVVTASIDGWGALYLGTTASIDVPLYGELRFRLRGGDGAGPLTVVLVGAGGGAGPASEVTPVAGSWTEAAIDLADLGSPGQISGVWFQDATGDGAGTVYVDDLRIVGGAAPPASAGPELTVDLTGGSITRTVVDAGSGVELTTVLDFPRPISEGVYGLNFATDALREELDVPVNRWGGNSTERFNHLEGSTATGNDWYFMGGGEDLGSDHAFEDDNQADGTETILTLPLTGWVTTAEPGCGFPVDVVTGQDDSQPHYEDPSLICGNGRRGGELILDEVDPTRTSRPADESFAADWVADLVAEHGTAAEGGVETYALGNEPNLWQSTHADVRPDPLGRAELIDRNRTWAAAVKDADPSAEVIGPVLWSGWSYQVTAEELLVDGARPGDVPTLVADYLDAMAVASEAEGERLLDALAVNFYDDRTYGAGDDALRLEATRSLWDPTYAPEDWWVVRDFYLGDGAAVVPRLRGLIDRHYPGTELAITEYNFGGSTTFVGGLAQLQALAILGREGVDTATSWEPWAEWVGRSQEEHGDLPFFWAYRMFRNYDGEGGRYGDEALFAASADEPSVAVYAARRTSDEAVTILVVNTTTAPVESPLAVPGLVGEAERFEWSGADATAIRSLGSSSFDERATLTLPARSATLLVVGADETDPGEPAGVIVADGARLVEPPATTVEGGPLDAEAESFVWVESGPVTLDDELVVDLAPQGAWGGADGGGVTIPAGSTVCSLFVHGDRLDDSGVLTGSLRLTDARVLGVAASSGGLWRSRFLRAPEVEHRIGKMEPLDRVEVTDDAVAWEMWFGPATDQLRVITDCGG